FILDGCRSFYHWTLSFCHVSFFANRPYLPIMARRPPRRKSAGIFEGSWKWPRSSCRFLTHHWNNRDCCHHWHVYGNSEFLDVVVPAATRIYYKWFDYSNDRTYFMDVSFQKFSQRILSFDRILQRTIP